MLFYGETYLYIVIYLYTFIFYIYICIYIYSCIVKYIYVYYFVLQLISIKIHDILEWWSNDNVNVYLPHYLVVNTIYNISKNVSGKQSNKYSIIPST